MENFQKVWVYEDLSFDSWGVHYTPQEWDLEIELTANEIEELGKLELENLTEYIQNKIARYFINH